MQKAQRGAGLSGMTNLFLEQVQAVELWVVVAVARFSFAQG